LQKRLQTFRRAADDFNVIFRVVHPVIAQNFLPDEVKIRIPRVAGQELATQLFNGAHPCLADQIGAQPLLCLHEKHIVDPIGGRARDHGVRAAESHIPAPFGHALIVVRRIGGLMKVYRQVFLSEEPLVFSNQQGRPALIAGDVECIHHNISPRPLLLLLRLPSNP
jgi:hypothetical protein